MPGRAKASDLVWRPPLWWWTSGRASRELAKRTVQIVLRGALDDELVRETVEHLPHAQAARVALFNLRCTGDPTAPPVWLDHEAREIAG
jgi:hypothetical protein